MADMAAGAFRALCEHLQQRGDQVQNIDLMTVGGFCRNCLAKVRSELPITFYLRLLIFSSHHGYRTPIQWLVLEARKLSMELGVDRTASNSFARNDKEHKITVDALDSFGYDEAAKLVYGESILEWKKRHQRSATEEQL